MKYMKKGWGKTQHQKQPSYVNSFGDQVFETSQFRTRVKKSRKKAKMARAARRGK